MTVAVEEQFVHDYRSAQPDDLYVQHLFPMRFEEEFDFKSMHAFVQRNFHRYIYITLALYVMAIMWLSKVMRDRKPYDLKNALFGWNIVLALFSAVGSVRTMGELIAVFRAEGLRGTICHQGNAFGVTGLWTFLFVISKIPEFVDTMFIVLRKRPLIFLHYYHHVQTAYYSIWAFIAPVFPMSRYFIAINFTVHALMYTYYALKATRLRIPRLVSMMITWLQISQMFICSFVISRALVTDCPNYRPALYAGLLTYLIYVILFANYFYSSYIKSSANRRLMAANATTKSQLGTASMNNNVDLKKAL